MLRVVIEEDAYLEDGYTLNGLQVKNNIISYTYQKYSTYAYERKYGSFNLRSGAAARCLALSRLKRNSFIKIKSKDLIR